MPLHRVWAQRLRWRRRLFAALALLLPAAALALWRGEAGWLLFSALGFLLPYPGAEEAALRAIDRHGLAYRAWLETPKEDPLYPRLATEAEAQAKRLSPPPVPLWAGALYLAALLTLLLLAGPAPIQPGLAEPPPLQAPKKKAASPAPRGAKEQQTKTKAAQRGAQPNAPGPTPAAPGQNAPAKPPPKAAPKPRAGTPQKAREMAQPQGAPGARPPAPRPPTNKSGTAKEPAPAQRAPGPQADAKPPAKTPEPPPVEQPEARALPSPWPAGRPPEAVRQRAETYLADEPLPPELAELLRRYFELSP